MKVTGCPAGNQIKWPMPSDAKFSLLPHHVNFSCDPPASLSQIFLPISRAWTTEIFNGEIAWGAWLAGDRQVLMVRHAILEIRERWEGEILFMCMGDPFYFKYTRVSEGA